MGTVDCGRGTIQSDATAASLPTGTASYTVLLEFKCTWIQPGDQHFYAWGSGTDDSMNGLIIDSTDLHAYWYNNDLQWYFSDSGMTIVDVCDGAWHTTGTQYDLSLIHI